MPDKAVNKVEYGGRTLIDLSGDTLTDPSQLRSGVTAHDRSGNSIVGTLMEKFAGYGEAVAASGNGYDVTISGLTSIADGTVIAVKFPSSIFAAADALLNVNSLGARHLAYEGYILGACTLNLGTQKICQLHSQGYIPKDSVVMLVASKAVAVTGGTEQDVWTIINPQETCLFGNCTTAAGTAAKTVAIPGVFEQFQGLTIKVWFSYSNTASNPTLSVNGLPAAPIIRNSSYASSNAAGSWQQMAVVTLTYIVNGGTAYWSMNDWNNSTYSNASLGHVYGTCSAVNSGTGECTVVASNYQLGTGAIVSVAFSVDVPMSATLNINSKGAKPIYHEGAALAQAGIINQGDTATFIYDGSHYVLIAVDRIATESQVAFSYANLDDLMYERSTIRVYAPGFSLRQGSLLVVTFDDNPVNMTSLDIGGTVVPVYAAAYIVPKLAGGGDVQFVYDGESMRVLSISMVQSPAVSFVQSLNYNGDTAVCVDDATFGFGNRWGRLVCGGVGNAITKDSSDTAVKVYFKTPSGTYSQMGFLYKFSGGSYVAVDTIPAGTMVQMTFDKRSYRWIWLNP